jgi:C-terminal processing protease CtpA/Prc
MLKSTILIASVLLFGSASNVPGRIGITCNHGWSLFSKKYHISHVYKDSPAEKAGLLKGDLIIAVDDVDILGSAGTFVNLTIQRGEKTFKVIIKRCPYTDIDSRH